MNLTRVSLKELLAQTVELRGSDLHVAAGSVPRVRISGSLVPLGTTSLGMETAGELVNSVLTLQQREQLKQRQELDFSYELPQVGRFRVAVFRQRRSWSATFRPVPPQVPALEELGLPEILNSLAHKQRGLILVSGPTGSGKSTTLAALIDHINQHRCAHVLTIEDPVEYLHQHLGCLVSQREVGIDTASFSDALRTALRADPDVVLLGEMRDLETTEAALRIAETGHLTLATLHTNSAPAAVHRIIALFPASQQEQIRAQLALVLEAVVCQTLLPRRKEVGRVAATEILVATPAIRNLIRENRVHQIHSVMQTGQTKHRMHTLNQSLAQLCSQGLVDHQEALASSPRPEELRKLLGNSAGHMSPTGAP